MPQPGFPNLDAAALAPPFAPISTQVGPLSNGASDQAMLVVEIFVGLLLVVSGGGLYWAYASLTYVPTIAERHQQRFDQAAQRNAAERARFQGGLQASPPAVNQNRLDWEADAERRRVEQEARQEENRRRAEERAAEYRARREEQINQSNADSGEGERPGSRRTPFGPGFRPPRPGSFD
jgi:hypothetical protein